MKWPLPTAIPFRLFRQRRANSVCCFGSSSITFSRVRTTRGKPASESGVSDAWCKMVYAERHDSIIAGPLLNFRVSKNLRSSQTGIVGTGSGSLLNRGAHVGREWRLLDEGGGGRVGCSRFFV